MLYVYEYLDSIVLVREICKHCTDYIACPPRFFNDMISHIDFTDETIHDIISQVDSSLINRIYAAIDHQALEDVCAILSDSCKTAIIAHLYQDYCISLHYASSFLVEELIHSWAKLRDVSIATSRPLTNVYCSAPTYFVPRGTCYSIEQINRYIDADLKAEHKSLQCQLSTDGFYLDFDLAGPIQIVHDKYSCASRLYELARTHTNDIMEGTDLLLGAYTPGQFTMFPRTAKHVWVVDPYEELIDSSVVAQEIISASMKGHYFIIPTLNPMRSYFQDAIYTDRDLTFAEHTFKIQKPTPTTSTNYF